MKMRAGTSVRGSGATSCSKVAGRRNSARLGSGRKLAVRPVACAAPSGKGDLEAFPQIRVRKASHRRLELLIEAAVANERLNVGERGAVSVRQRAEWLRLRMRRENWESIFENIMMKDAALTLSSIEAALREVDEALFDEHKEKQPIGLLKSQLEDLQEKVGIAHERLHMTENRLKFNIDRLDDLKKEAAKLDRGIQESRVTEELSPVAPTTAEPSTPEPARAPSHASSSSALASTPEAYLPGRQASRTGRRGLEANLHLSKELKSFWYPVEFASKVDDSTLIPFELFGTPWVLFKDGDGSFACVHDSCAHRACPLSLGKVVDGRIQCAYHGWEFEKDGRCSATPSTKHCANVKISSLTCTEKDGMIWVWGDEAGDPDKPLPTEFAMPAGFDCHAEITMDVPVEHGLLLENLMDLAHAPFTHTSTFAKGWSVPDFVNFETAARTALSGNWDPYPIDMAFGAPCMVLSTIGLERPGSIVRGIKAKDCKKHLHQLHVCLPSRPGHTRLLYRLGMDSFSWLRHVPGIDLVWQDVARQVLGEDLRLVLGQQERMQQGNDVWGNPVQYDKLGVKYRKWRNNLNGSNVTHAQEVYRIDAGDIFLEP